MWIIFKIALAGVAEDSGKRGLGFPCAWEKKTDSPPPADEPFICSSLLCLWPALLRISVGQAGVSAKLARCTQSRWGDRETVICNH